MYSRMGRRAGGSMTAQIYGAICILKSMAFDICFTGSFCHQRIIGRLSCAPVWLRVLKPPPARYPPRGNLLYLSLSCKPGTAMGHAQKILLLWQSPRPASDPSVQCWQLEAAKPDSCSDLRHGMV